MNYSMSQLGEYKFMRKCFLDKKDKNLLENQKILHFSLGKNLFRLRMTPLSISYRQKKK